MDCNIPANPEIAGVGVRVSIYAQALLGFALAGLALYRYASEYGEAFGGHARTDIENLDPTRSEIELLFRSDLPTKDVLSRLQRTYLRDEKEDRRDLRVVRMSLQLTGAALLIAAAIQSAGYGLDVYHALIVLNLCWLINVTLVTLYLTEMYLLHPRKHFLKYPFPPSFFTFQGLKKSEPFVPTSLYLSGLGAYGLWIFAGIDYFGDTTPECNAAIEYWMFGHRISATSNGFRIFGLVLHAVIACPLLNVVEEMFLSCRLAMAAESFILLPYRLFRQINPSKFRPAHGTNHHGEKDSTQVSNYRMGRTVVALAFQYIFLVIVFVLGTEETIMVNYPHVEVEPGGASESAWTFGQTLVMMLLLPLVFDLWAKIRETMQTWKVNKVEDKRIEDAVVRNRREQAQNATGDPAARAQTGSPVEEAQEMQRVVPQQSQAPPVYAESH